MDRKRWFAIAGVVAVASLALFVTACGGGEDGNGAASTATDAGATKPADQNPAKGVVVDVPHWEWEMSISVDSAPAGEVTFNAINEGTILHNLKVARTDLAPDALPVDDSTLMVDEDQVEVLASSKDLDVGQAEELTLELEPGSYVLFCNIPAHYQAGLYAGFTVE